jgi:hypothetical protein
VPAVTAGEPVAVRRQRGRADSVLKRACGFGERFGEGGCVRGRAHKLRFTVAGDAAKAAAVGGRPCAASGTRR